MNIEALDALSTGKIPLDARFVGRVINEAFRAKGKNASKSQALALARSLSPRPVTKEIRSEIEAKVESALLLEKNRRTARWNREDVFFTPCTPKQYGRMLYREILRAIRTAGRTDTAEVIVTFDQGWSSSDIRVRSFSATDRHRHHQVYVRLANTESVTIPGFQSFSKDLSREIVFSRGRFHHRITVGKTTDNHSSVTEPSGIIGRPIYRIGTQAKVYSTNLPTLMGNNK